FTNISFVARTVDWNPLHLYQTLKAAYEHVGFSFVHILQRCPTYTEGLFEELRSNPDLTLLLTHEDGIPADPPVERMYKNRREHDPSNLAGARELAGMTERLPIGLFYRNPAAPRYEAFTEAGLGMTADEKVANLERELDRFAI
ncbi:MAG TPA: 2-oxoglutarate oxidoreductase, partial [Thermoanaerobaculia bacterium]